MRFNQIFVNLLSNAAKYTPEGGHVEFLSEHIPGKNGKHGMRFVIRDNGIGMSKDYQKVLFEPYSQEYGHEHKEQRGTGLGLAIVKQIVDLAEGSIRVESEINKGTTFTVDLYAYNEDAAPADMKKPDYYPEIMRGLRVLLVEDSEINQVILKKNLEFLGCLVDTAANGEEAVRCFAQSEIGYYKVILTDLRMPVMDGFEEVSLIRGMDRLDAKTIPVIAATADAHDEFNQRILNAGMNGTLVKPIDAATLCEMIAKLVGTQENHSKAELFGTVSAISHDFKH
ncbi:MAG: response regulator [Clostridia bacterium]|mgnify:CR=1 FL=1|nr:response regulator [Clostridia bacterium]